jgi:hypothetical protein
MLINAGIVAERDLRPGESWNFTRALLRDAVLSTLARSRRRELFGALPLRSKNQSAPDDEDVELLAYYDARSADAAKALYYQERAAERPFALVPIRRVRTVSKRQLSSPSSSTTQKPCGESRAPRRGDQDTNRESPPLGRGAASNRGVSRHL